MKDHPQELWAQHVGAQIVRSAAPIPKNCSTFWRAHADRDSGSNNDVRAANRRVGSYARDTTRNFFSLFDSRRRDHYSGSAFAKQLPMPFLKAPGCSSSRA
jgi:hypothetical protein